MCKVISHEIWVGARIHMCTRSTHTQGLPRHRLEARRRYSYGSSALQHDLLVSMCRQGRVRGRVECSYGHVYVYSVRVGRAIVTYASTQHTMYDVYSARAGQLLYRLWVA